MKTIILLRGEHNFHNPKTDEPDPELPEPNILNHYFFGYEVREI